MVIVPTWVRSSVVTATRTASPPPSRPRRGCTTCASMRSTWVRFEQPDRLPHRHRDLRRRRARPAPRPAGCAPPPPPSRNRSCTSTAIAARWVGGGPPSGRSSACSARNVAAARTAPSDALVGPAVEGEFPPTNAGGDLRLLRAGVDPGGGQHPAVVGPAGPGPVLVDQAGAAREHRAAAVLVVGQHRVALRRAGRREQQLGRDQRAGGVLVGLRPARTATTRSTPCSRRTARPSRRPPRDRGRASPPCAATTARTGRRRAGRSRRARRSRLDQTEAPCGWSAAISDTAEAKMPAASRPSSARMASGLPWGM